MAGRAAERIVSVTGLGYVGLPVAVAFANAGRQVMAFDIDQRRISELRAGEDRTGEVAAAALKSVNLLFTDDPAEVARADFHIVTVPTPVTDNRLPDFRPLQSASRTIGKLLKRGDIVVYESTVYPGATEEICIPILEQESGLVFGQGFSVGYSPERINPGDPDHRFETIRKVVSGSDSPTLDIVADVYGSVVAAGVHRAGSIKVAEAAKVIENTQRDLNIALMNELAMIFDRIGIRTSDVLEAAGTKWNFLRFTPGLVGGHCIGVDPYYLTAKAEAVGYRPEVILAGRRVNDGVGAFIAQKTMKALSRAGRGERPRVGILGLTFKENVPDLRNSKVEDIFREFIEYGVTPLVHDPFADAREAHEEYGIRLSSLDEMTDLDALVVAVPHDAYRELALADLSGRLRQGGSLVDVKSWIDPAALRPDIAYWSL